MLKLNYDCFNNISEYLSAKDNINIITSSKTMLETYGREGYIQNYCNSNISGMDLFNIMCKHKNTLNSISLSSINNPNLWMPYWVKKVNFINCNFDNGIINPDKDVDTEELYIYSTQKNITFDINWIKFPKLKKFIIRAYKIESLPINVEIKIITIPVPN